MTLQLPREEDLFAEELRKKGHRLPGGEWGWRFEDVSLVVKECEKFGFAILGGQVQFIVPGGTCEMYWLRADPHERLPNEGWGEFSQRTRVEFSCLFGQMIKKADLDKEIAEWPFLREKREQGVDVMSYLWFIMYPISEIGYIELSSTQ